MADDCNPCSTPSPVCTDCTQVLQQITYCADGCLDSYQTDCIFYSGPDVTLSGGVVIHNGDNLSGILGKLSANSLDVSLGAVFNPVSRILTLTKNGTIYASATISDQDNQYLLLDGTKLQIWSNTASGAIKINEVDLSLAIPETTFAAQSSTLLISPGGTKGHSPTIELGLSGDVGNKAITGSDGLLFVPTDAPGIKDVIITSVQGLSFTKSIQNGVITLLPVLDFAYIASQVCPLCSPSCGVPSDLNVQTI